MPSKKENSTSNNPPIKDLKFTFKPILKNYQILKFSLQQVIENTDKLIRLVDQLPDIEVSGESEQLLVTNKSCSPSTPHLTL